MKIGVPESNPSMPQREDALFLIEGVLDRLSVEAEPDRLLSRIAHRTSNHGTDGPIDGALAQAASDIERTLYFVEDTQYFAGLIDGRPVCGEFAGADKLKPGHRVKATVSRSGNALRAYAILDPQQGWLWSRHPRGSAADAKAERKLALWLFCCCYFGMASLFGLASWWSGPGQYGWVEVQSWILLGNAIVFGAMALSANYRRDRPAQSQNWTLGLLGFADPRRIDLTSYRIQDVAMRKHLAFIHANKQALRSGRMSPIDSAQLLRESSDRHRDVYDYRQAIADGKATVRR